MAEAIDAAIAVIRGKTTYDAALEFERVGRELPVEQVPAFFVRAARELARRGDHKRAATFFSKAQSVEAEEQLPIADEDWLALHREFAALGALSTKVVADFVKGLKTRAKPDVAVDTLIRVAALRAQARQTPWPQLPKQLSAFAGAAGRDEVAVHKDLLEQMVGAPALAESSAAMWTAWRPILVQVCEQSPKVRGLLLNLLPVPESLDGWWLELLEECGATAGLIGAAEAGAEPAGGRAAWLERTVHHPNLSEILVRRNRNSRTLPQQLSDLIVRMAPALRSDGVPVHLDGPDFWTRLVDVQVLETCLAHGVPVADLPSNAGLNLELWWRSRRSETDLAAILADPRFAPAVQQWAAKGNAARLWTVPALRPFLTPPPDVETAPHPLDGPRIYSAIHAFGAVGVEGGAPQRLLYSIRTLTTSTEGYRRKLGWTADLIGRIEWTVLRAVAPSTPDDRRELLTAFLEVWAESPLADPDSRLYRDDDLELEIGWGTADRLRSLVALLREHGGVPRDPAAAAILSAQGGLSRHAAEMALAGLIGIQSYHPPLMGTAERKALGITAKQVEDGRGELSTIQDGLRLNLLQGILPEDPAALWRPGGTKAVAERLAANWVDFFGRRVAIPDETIASAPDFGRSTPAQEVCMAVADPAGSALLTQTIDSWLVPGRRDSPAWYSSSIYSIGEFERRLSFLTRTVCWAYAGLPAGNPVRDGVPEAMRLLRERLDHPGLILSAGAAVRGTTVEDLAQRFGPNPYTGRVPLEADDTTFDDGLTIVAIRGTRNRFYFRPAFLGVDSRTADLDAVAGYGRYTLDAVRFLTSPAFVSIVERIASGALEAGACEADPRASVPEIVAQVADHLGLPTDPAALHLQLLALPHPTDARVKAWNSWSPAQHKKAVAVLIDKGLVIADKRSKAGRGVFLPGAWTPAAKIAGSYPVEDWKTGLLTSLGVSSSSEWPPVLLPGLFAAARDRVLADDLPE